MLRGSTGTDRQTLSVETGDYVAGMSAGYENQAYLFALSLLVLQYCLFAFHYLSCYLELKRTEYAPLFSQGSICTLKLHLSQRAIMLSSSL